MTETDQSEIDALAGEYVLGTLSADERRAAEARYPSDRSFRMAVSAWERRLQPLADGAPPVAPPSDTFDRILARIDASAPPISGDNVIQLRLQVRRWRITTVLAGAAAAALAAVVVFDRTQPAPQSEFVAVLTAEGQNPQFIAAVDVTRGTLSIRRVGAPAPADKSYELWAVEPNQAPRSLGVVEEASLQRTLDAQPADLTLAISLEPKGGSPTGAPTGPVVFTGQLIPTE